MAAMPAGMDADFRLGEWLVQPSQCRLSRDGRTVQVRAKVMDLLTYLAAHPGEVVSKDRLLDDVWGSQAVSESALTRTMTELRQALGDSADEPKLLETIPKRGYRLVGSISPVDTTSETDAPSSPGRRGVRFTVTLVVAACVVVSGLVSWVWLRPDRRASSVKLAILPFDYIGTDREHEYLAEGLTEDTTVSLGMVAPDRLMVIGRTSTARYKGSPKSLTEISDELRADYFVNGTLRTEGRRLRLTASLIRARDQTLVWTQSFERELTSVLGLQLEVSAAIAEQVRVRVPEQRRDSIEQRHTRNAEAFDLYLRGRTLWDQRTPAMNQLAIEYYKRAIALDPAYALAWSGIADVYGASPINGDADPLIVRPSARHAAAEAVRVNANLAEAQTSMAVLQFWLEWDWARAETAARRAVTLNPADAFSRHALANVLSHSGRHAEALEEIRSARELEPLDPMLYAMSSQFAFHARDYTSAVQHARQALALNPEFWVGHMQLGQAQAAAGAIEPALEALDRAAHLSGGNSKPVSTRGYVLATAGRTSEARAVLQELDARSRDRYLPPYAKALVLAGLGDGEAVFKSLEAAVKARDVHLVFLPVDPKWDAYRTDPRFAALLDRCGFMRRQ